MIGCMHKNVQRLNVLISDNSTECDGLTNDTINREKEYIAELKDLEGDVARTSAKIEQSKIVKDNLYEDIVQVEKEVLLWRRKIAIEKEMIEALQPNGEEEDLAAAMRKEIHKMKLKLSEMHRYQEKLIQVI